MKPATNGLRYGAAYHKNVYNITEDLGIGTVSTVRTGELQMMQPRENLEGMPEETIPEVSLLI
jgi:hypothetical protein